MTKYFNAHAGKRTLVFLLAVLMLNLPLLAQTAATSKAKLPAIETEIVERITIDSIKASAATLAADDMEGRGTGQPGGEKAANWIADKFKEVGLKPAGENGTYFQTVKFNEITPTEMSFKAGNVDLAFGSDFALVPMNNGNKSASGGLVWVSYGLQSKANDVDMLEDVSLSGKVVIIRDGPPPGISDKDWEKSKMGMNIRIGIMRSGVSAIVIVTNSDAKQPAEELISYFKRRQISMAGEKGYPPQVPPIIYMSAAGAEKLFKEAGMNFTEEMAAGNTKTFKGKDLKIKAKISAKYTEKKVTANNVVGVLEGSDPTLKSEAVLFSAHYDAFGKIDGQIYNGAADNALGTAEMISVAEAYSKLSQKPKRSMVFLAVTGEEYGLYGSKAWAKDPTWDIKKVAANLNLDGIGSEVYGPVKTIVGFGAEHSTIGTLLNDLAGSLDINVIPDPMPDEKIFYRSDHYSFVERGVPSLMLLGAPGGEKEVWMERIKEWEKGDYHQPGDDILDTWAWEGAETVAEVMGVLGWRISEAAAMPSWLPNSRFGDLKRGNTKELPSEDEEK